MTIAFHKSPPENFNTIIRQMANASVYINCEVTHRLKTLVAADHAELCWKKEQGHTDLTDYKAIVHLKKPIDYVIATVYGEPSIIFGVPVQKTIASYEQHQERFDELKEMIFRQIRDRTVKRKKFLDQGAASLLDKYDNRLINVKKVSRDYSSLLVFEDGTFIIDTDNYLTHHPSVLLERK